MNFTAIDFETATAHDPCEVGLCRVENGQIVATQSWLIKPACYPYMGYWNQKVHGIASSQLVKEQEFDKLWGQLESWFQNTRLVAHNANFDMGVLRDTLAHYQLPTPELDYFCSVQLARKAWKELPNHKLNTVSDFLGIQFNHHRAGDDAQACAKLVLSAFETFGEVEIVTGLANIGIKIKPL